MNYKYDPNSHLRDSTVEVKLGLLDEMMPAILGCMVLLEAGIKAGTVRSMTLDDLKDFETQVEELIKIMEDAGWRFEQ